MSYESLSSKQRAAFEQAIKQADPYKNAMAFGQAVADLDKHFGFHSIRHMEVILREMDSDTYLLAVPFTSEVEDFTSKLYHSGDHEYPYYLWICVNGWEEAQEKMEEIETNPGLNLQDLEQTGMLVSKPTSSSS